MITGGGSVVSGNVVETGAWVDMCRVYGCLPGTDVTTAIQTAVNLANTNNLDTTLYFSTPGVYNLNGAQQSGTAFAYNYSGQVLFPARAFSLDMIHIRIMGLSPFAGFGGGFAPSVPNGGVVLLPTQPPDPSSMRSRRQPTATAPRPISA